VPWRARLIAWSVPLILGSDEDFATVCDLLLKHKFLEQPIVDRLQAPTDEINDGLDVIVALFARAQAVDATKATSLLGDAGLSALLSLGLASTTDGAINSNCLLYPFEDLWIASDFPGGSRDDFVFPALTAQSSQFHSILPDTACAALLDIGTGAGAAALTAAKDYAAVVSAADISPRCVLFAEFNRRLNHVTNLTVQSSDVYAAFDGETFDRIIAHPPYIPTLGDGESYRHGGAHGEDVLQRILAGLPLHLRPGGRAYLSTLGCDHAETSLEQRALNMIGDQANDFRLLLAEWESLPAVEFVMRLVEVGELSFDQAARQVKSFRDAGVTQLVKCAIVVSREEAVDGPQVVRRTMGEGTTAAELDAAFGTPTIATVDPLEQKLVLTPWSSLESTSGVSGGHWRAYNRILDCQYPFRFTTDCPEWAANALARLDGDTTLRAAIGDTPVDPEEAEIFFECLCDAGVLLKPAEN
jgi:methylase of polypeptide subunit release factors